MLASQRFENIIAITNERGFVSTKELSNLLAVTETTIRRDCEELEQQGFLLRVHGGAKSMKQKRIISYNDETTMNERFDLNGFEKEIICKKAASFVKDGDCIFLDGGTTVVSMLKYLRGKKIKIVTHSTLIANAFEDEDAELFMVGGKYIIKYNMSIGQITLSTLERFNFDHVFLSCSGIDIEKQMIYTTEMDTMAVKQKAFDLGIHKYMLVDNSKFQVKGFCNFISSSQFDGIISNQSDVYLEDELPDNFILVK